MQARTCIEMFSLFTAAPGRILSLIRSETNDLRAPGDVHPVMASARFADIVPCAEQAPLRVRDRYVLCEQ